MFQVVGTCLLQVHTYLNAYAADRRASLPHRHLHRVNQLYRAACNTTLEASKQGDDAELHRYVEMMSACCSHSLNTAI